MLHIHKLHLTSIFTAMLLLFFCFSHLSLLLCFSFVLRHNTPKSFNSTGQMNGTYDHYHKHYTTFQQGKNGSGKLALTKQNIALTPSLQTTNRSLRIVSSLKAIACHGGGRRGIVFGQLTAQCGASHPSGTLMAPHPLSLTTSRKRA